MKTLKGKKNIAVIPLLIITMAVWGTIIYNIITGFTGNKSGENEIINYTVSQNPYHKNTDDQTESELSYKELDRDPFTLHIQMQEKDEKNTAPPVIKTYILPTIKPKTDFRISGVIVNKKSRLVIIEDASTGGTVFLREGDEYKGIAVRSIDVNKITITENKETREIPVAK